MQLIAGAETRRRLERWFESRIPDARELTITNVARLSAGHSNETFSIDVRWRKARQERQRAFVLRTRPEGEGLLEPYDVARQYHVMRCLYGTPVPVPKMYWLEEDERVFGKAFFIMEKLEGAVIEEDIPEYVLKGGPEKWRRMCTRFVEMEAALHNIDWRARGLGFLGDGENFLDRQLARWESGMRRVQQGELPAFEVVLRWLKENKPRHCTRTTLVHGDYKLGNCLFQGETIIGVFDWELADIGDPLADIGWCLGNWSLLGRLTAMPGALSEAEIVELYERFSGIKVENLVWYVTLGLFALSVIFLAASVLFQTGKSQDLRYVSLGQIAGQTVKRALGRIGITEDVPAGNVAPSMDRIVAGLDHAVRGIIVPELTSQEAKSQALVIPAIIRLLAADSAVVAEAGKRA